MIVAIKLYKDLYAQSHYRATNIKHSSNNDTKKQRKNHKKTHVLGKDIGGLIVSFLPTFDMKTIFEKLEKVAEYHIDM